jgi:hypothetical protein
MDNKINPQFTEKKVIFYFCDCCLNNKYSFYNIKKENAEKLIKRLKFIEKMDWRTFGGLPREDGITSEFPNSKSFEMIDSQNSCEDKIIERYYFHFRVEKKRKV